MAWDAAWDLPRWSDLERKGAVPYVQAQLERGLLVVIVVAAAAVVVVVVVAVAAVLYVYHRQREYTRTSNDVGYCWLAIWFGKN